jgi:hypothetical protein
MSKRRFALGVSAISLALAPALCYLGLEAQLHQSGIERINIPRFNAWSYGSGWPVGHPQYDQGIAAQLYSSAETATGKHRSLNCTAAYSSVERHGLLTCSRSEFDPGSGDEVFPDTVLDFEFDTP